MIQKLIAAYLAHIEGSAVREQFLYTWNRMAFSDAQNTNALEIILEHCANFKKAKVFTDTHDLEGYIIKLKDYLESIKHINND